MTHQVVEYDGNVFDFPKTIARKRTNKDIYDKITISCISLGAGCLLCEKSYLLKFLTSSTSYSYLILVGLEMLNRICAFREEYSHIESRYKNNLKVLLEKLFSFNQNINICTAITAIYVLQNVFGNQESILQLINSTGLAPWIFSFTGVKFMTDILELDESTVKTAKIIDRIHGLDYGSGMAINFFYGYLNFMLPATGEHRKSLEENINDYASSRGGVTFASKKLFIFLPESGKCPKKVSDYSRGLLEQTDKLESKEIDRGGVKGRVYHCTVYKILRNMEKKHKNVVHICCEFASALNTFYEVREHRHAVTTFYEEYKHEIVTNFFMTLQKLIEEKNFTNMCELIYFQDKDENGRIMYEDRLDIGDLLLRRLNLPPAS